MKTNTLSRTEQLSYLAGVIDSEGSIYITKSSSRKNRSRYRAAVQIAMNDKAALLLFQKFFGGKILVGSRKLNVKTKELYTPAYIIRHTSADAVKAILRTLYPYLQVKKNQAKIVLKFLTVKDSVADNFERNGRLNNLFLSCRASKSQGWIKS